MPEVSTTVQINIQFERIREQQEKNRKKTAREASKACSRAERLDPGRDAISSAHLSRQKIFSGPGYNYIRFLFYEGYDVNG